MALLQHQHYQRRRRRLEVEEEVRRQMFIGVAAFPTAALVLGHAQQADYGKEAGGIGDSDAGLSEPEQVQAWQHGGSGGKRSCAAEMHNLSEKRRRSKINKKMKALQSLIPNSNKTMLDEAIEYLKQLQLQVQASKMSA